MSVFFIRARVGRQQFVAARGLAAKGKDPHPIPGLIKRVTNLSLSEASFCCAESFVRRPIPLSLLWAHRSQAPPRNFFLLMGHPGNLEVESLTKADSSWVQVLFGRRGPEIELVAGGTTTKATVGILS